MVFIYSKMEKTKWPPRNKLGNSNERFHSIFKRKYLICQSLERVWLKAIWISMKTMYRESGWKSIIMFMEELVIMENTTKYKCKNHNVFNLAKKSRRMLYEGIRDNNTLKNTVINRRNHNDWVDTKWRQFYCFESISLMLENSFMIDR